MYNSISPHLALNKTPNYNHLLKFIKFLLNPWQISWEYHINISLRFKIKLFPMGISDPNCCDFLVWKYRIVSKLSTRFMSFFTLFFYTSINIYILEIICRALCWENRTLKSLLYNFSPEQLIASKSEFPSSNNITMPPAFWSVINRWFS